MKKVYSIATLLMVALFLSCNDEDDDIITSGEYLIFGRYAGFCVGDCVDLYKIKADELLEDKSNEYPGGGFYKFNDFDKLPKEKFELVKDLIEFLPTSLRNEESGIFGQPGFTDGGSAYVEYKSGSIHKYWILDEFKGNMPAEYDQFVDKIREKVALIHQ